ncbi:MAG TPA: DJ-1/PfpI family protein [Rhizomicrobium sp.]|nr:DJ-1/PfpI family protein [Rhizomicrobium sp.]
MTLKIGFLLFNDAEELDFVGPWEVVTMANEVAGYSDKSKPFEPLMIAKTMEPVRCRKGMRVLPDATLTTCGKLDIILIPGGQGTRTEVKNEVLLDWIAKTAPQCRWITSVCTGALLLTAAGPAKGKRVTTHWGFVDQLRARNEAAEVLENVRYARDGNVVTAAGVSAGIDMALWLVGQIESPEFARNVQRAMEYDPAPPYAAAT